MQPVDRWDRQGHLVLEVDALDGLMGGLIDRAGIHFRMLNRRKGPAVQGPRAQADRDLYREAALAAVLGVDGLTIHEGSVEDLLVEKSSSAGGGAHRVGGVQLAGGEALRAGRVVLTTGTSCAASSTSAARSAPPAASCATATSARTTSSRRRRRSRGRSIGSSCRSAG